MPSGGIYKGWLLKKATSVSAYLSWTGWRRRFCVVRDDRLEYFLNEGDKEPRGALMFGENCKVEYVGKMREKYHAFRIYYGQGESISFAAPTMEQYKRWESVITGKIRSAALARNRSKSASVAAVQSMLIEMENYGGDTDASLTDEEDEENPAEESGVENLNITSNEKSRSKSISTKKKTRLSSLDIRPPALFAPILRSFASRDMLCTNASWNLIELKERLRLFDTRALVCDPDVAISLNDPSNSVNHAVALQCLKSQGVVQASPTKVFRLIMDLSDVRKKWDEMFESGCLVKELDPHNDIIQFTTKRVGVKTASGIGQLVFARRFIVHRHWRRDSYGCFEVIYRSVDPNKYALEKSNVLPGHMTGLVIRMSPTLIDDGKPACIVTSCVHLNLGGWVWPRGLITDSYCTKLLLTLSKLRKLVEQNPDFDICKIDPIVKSDTIKIVEIIRARSSYKSSSESAAMRARMIMEEQQDKEVSESNENQAQRTTEGEAVASGEEKLLNYEYSIPKNNFLFPMMKSPKGISAWWDSGVEKGFWNVRGPNYLSDKVKVPNEVSAMQLLQMQWSFYDQPKRNIAKDPNELVQLEHEGRDDRPFLLVINFMVPTVGNWVCYFAKRKSVHDETFDRMLNEFITGDDKHRNSRFKIIPNVVEGSYFAKRGIGSTPAILGKKIDTDYYSGKNWFEICVNVGSSKVAGSLMNIVKMYAKSLVIDLAFLIESQTNDELPERLIGGARMHFPLMYPVDDISPYLMPEPEKLSEEEVNAATAELEALEEPVENEDASPKEDAVTSDGPEIKEDPSDTAKEATLNYTYDIPEVTSVFPKDLTKNGMSSWFDSGSISNFLKVRGPDYLTDKVKVPNEISAMEIVQCQWSFFDEPKRKISFDPDELIQKQHVGRSDRPFMLVINFMVPTIGNFAVYFAKRRGVSDPKFDRMLQEFIDGDDEFRNSKFKIIPGVVEGYYIVKKGVGNKPAILGRKITVDYYKGDNFFEICVDVGSSRVAGSLMSLVKGYAATIVIDLAFLFESQTEEDLPERILGAVRIRQPCMQFVEDRSQFLKQ